MHCSPSALSKSSSAISFFPESRNTLAYTKHVSRSSTDPAVSSLAHIVLASWSKAGEFAEGSFPFSSFSPPPSILVCSSAPHTAHMMCFLSLDRRYNFMAHRCCFMNSRDRA